MYDFVQPNGECETSKSDAEYSISLSNDNAIEGAAKFVTKESTGEKNSSEEKEMTSDALKGESKITSYWKILSPDGTLSNICDFNFSKYPKLEVLAKYESASPFAHLHMW